MGTGQRVGNRRMILPNCRQEVQAWGRRGSQQGRRISTCRAVGSTAMRPS